MDPLSTLKKIRKIISNIADRELVKLILDLQKEIFAIESHNLELASELASLKPHLDLPARMHTRPQSDYYFLDRDDVPFCPKCWESRGNAIHLQAPVSAGGKTRRECRVCRETYWDAAVTKGRSRAHHAEVRIGPLQVGFLERVRAIRHAIIDNDRELVWAHYRLNSRLPQTPFVPSTPRLRSTEKRQNV